MRHNIHIFLVRRVDFYFLFYFTLYFQCSRLKAICDVKTAKGNIIYHNYQFNFYSSDSLTQCEKLLIIPSKKLIKNEKKCPSATSENISIFNHPFLAACVVQTMYICSDYTVLTR